MNKSNIKPKYAIVDENGNILEEFRLKATALNNLHKIRTTHNRFGTYEIKKITDISSQLKNSYKGL